MKLARLAYEPSAMIEFFQLGLEALGAICERTWHDRLQVVAEGDAARLWDVEGKLVDRELFFPSPEDTAPREAEREVFCGCPLTFRLAETLNPPKTFLRKVVLASGGPTHAPHEEVAEKLWRLQFPETQRWKPANNFSPAWHFSLLTLVRCEIQAIDQHWSLHRLACSARDGAADEALAGKFQFNAVDADPGPVPWPAADPNAWLGFFKLLLEAELALELATIRQRQQNYLRRELDRVDNYFINYERELRQRLGRVRQPSARLEERLAAARSEHVRRRNDQIQRHEIRVIPHLDALLFIAEPAWKMNIETSTATKSRKTEALFIPRLRQWWLC